MKYYINHNLEICANENGWPEEPTPGDDIAAYHANMNYYRRWLKEAKEQSVIVYDVPHDLGLHFDVRNWNADMFIEMPCDVEFGWQFKNEDDQWINATNGDLRFIFAKYKTRKVARLKPSNAARSYSEGADMYQVWDKENKDLKIVSSDTVIEDLRAQLSAAEKRCRELEEFYWIAEYALRDIDAFNWVIDPIERARVALEKLSKLTIPVRKPEIKL